MLGVRSMALDISRQLREVLDSLARRDPEMAVDVWIRDADIDRLCTICSRELLACMAEDAGAVTFGIHLLFCTKNLERIGDHATNIAEAVYYMVKGETLSGERPKADLTSMATGMTVARSVSAVGACCAYSPPEDRFHIAGARSPFRTYSN
jgi:phosphate transport system protein